MEIRAYRESDCEALAQLFFDTVHEVNAGDYTKEQLWAWATGDVDLGAWNRSFRSHDTLVAVEDGVIAGFCDMDACGYLDRLYVHKDYQGRGIATALCDVLELRWGSGRIETHASVTARPFFEGRGYRVVKEQQVERRGQRLTNYVMERENPPVKEKGKD